MTTEVDLINTLTSIVAHLTFTVKSYDHIEGNVPINYTLSTSHSTVEVNGKTLENAVFNAENQVKVLCHDFNTTDGVKWYDYMTKEYLKRGKTTIFAMHYQVPQKELPDIEQAAYIRHLGKNLGDYIIELNNFFGVDLKNVHILGHKHGAHIAGIAGRRVLENLKEPVGRITSLDPTTMMFLSWNITEKLRGQDAKFVDSIQLSFSNYIGFNIAAFMVDRGQSKCDNEEMKTVYDAAPKVFSSTINGKQIRAYYCQNDTWGAHCQKSFVVVGENVDTKADGFYFLDEQEELCKVMDVKLKKQVNDNYI